MNKTPKCLIVTGRPENYGAAATDDGDIPLGCKVRRNECYHQKTVRFLRADRRLTTPELFEEEVPLGESNANGCRKDLKYIQCLRAKQTLQKIRGGRFTNAPKKRCVILSINLQT